MENQEDEQTSQKISKLERGALFEYLENEKNNLLAQKEAAKPPNWRELELIDPSIVAPEYQAPEFNTEEGMVARGLLDSNGDATPLGSDYLLLKERGLIKNGALTKKGEAFITPTEDLLPTSKIANFTSTLDPNDPEVLKSFELWRIKDDNKLNAKPEDEGNAILDIFKAVGGMAKAIGVTSALPQYTPEQREIIKKGGLMEALGEVVNPKEGYTGEQRAAVLAKAAEGASETAVTSSGKLGAFIDQNIINPARKLAGATDGQIKIDDQWSKFQVATRGAAADETTAANLMDAISGADDGAKLFATAKNDFVNQLGEVKGNTEFTNVMNGAYSAGGMLGDPVGLALTGGTAAFGKLINLAKAERVARAAKKAETAGMQLAKLDEAAAITGKTIEEATSGAAAVQKRIDDALLVGNTKEAMAAKSQLNDLSRTIKTSQDRMALFNDGIKVNQEVLQKASSKIDDINAPSMMAREAGSATVKKLGDAADTLGNGFLWTNKKLKAIEKGLGVGKLPYLLHAANIMSLGTGFKIYSGIRFGSLVAAPLLKKTAGFANVVGDEMLQLTNSSPFWRRVAANEGAGRMTQAFGGLMDYTTPITRGVAGTVKGTAQALPAMTLYEAINSQGLDENAMKRAGAGALVFGSFGRLIGNKNNWDRVKTNEFYNFRNKVKQASPEAFQQFESVPFRDVKQFAASVDAAYPGVFDSWQFVKDGNSKFDPVNKTATINYNDRASIVKATAAHEALHGIQFKNQSDLSVQQLMLGNETKGGLVRSVDGKFDPEFKQFWDEYNARLDSQGLPRIDVNDAALEYFTDNGAQTLFEDVGAGKLYKASSKTPLRRSIESAFKATMAATPIVKNLHFKLGGATDGTGRMVMGSGLLANGMRELPEVKAMIRNMYRESAGMPKQVPKHPIIKDEPSSNPKHYKGGEEIRKANEETVRSGNPLPENVLNPDSNGNGFGFLTDAAIKRLDESGAIAKGDFSEIVAIQGVMGAPVSYIVTNKPEQQGRSVQVEGITANNVVPISFETKNGRLYLVGMDMIQLKKNIAKAVKSDIAKKLKMNHAEILNDIDNVAQLHAKNQATDAYFQEKDSKNWERRKNFINSVQGLLTESQLGTNPMFSKRNLDKTSGIYRTFAWDRLGDKIQWTGEIAVPYGPNSYYNLRDNLVPQPSRMNRNGELIIEMPPSSKSKKTTNSISPLIYWASSRQMQREDK